MTGMPPDGILGLSLIPELPNVAVSLFNDGKLPSPEYSFYYIIGSHEISDGVVEHGGQLTLGGVDSTKFEGEITTINMDFNGANVFGQWVMALPSIYVGGEILVNTSNGGLPDTDALVFFDTGTPFMMAPDEATAIE